MLDFSTLAFLRVRVVTLMLASLAVFPSLAQPQDVPFVTVDGQEISAGRLEAKVQQIVRDRFYHGVIPRGQLDPIIAEASQALVDEFLLDREARRRGIEPEAEQVDARLLELQQRPGFLELPEDQRDGVVAALHDRLQAESRRAGLESAVRALADPDDVQAAEAWYRENLDLFVEPKRERVSLILVAVEPSATDATWAEAYAEANSLHARLQEGADFATLARDHSDDPTAEAGGDMGYLHAGMLSEQATAAIDKLEGGQVTPVLQILEGFAIFRLDDRVPPRQVTFEEARERALGLWRRDLAQRQWDAFVDDLRREASTVYDEDVMASMRQRFQTLVND